MSRLAAVLIAVALAASACTGFCRSKTAAGGSGNAAWAGPPGSRPGTSLSAGTPLAPASMPSGATPYDPWKPVKVGDAIELPILGLLLQVSGARVVDYDANRNLLLVDVVIGNKGRQPFTISSLTMMHAVSGDWHWYSLTLPELLHAAATLTAQNVRTFDTDLQPGEARKATAVLPVPKQARQIAFTFTPMDPVKPLDDVDPTVYVSLGIGGDFQPPFVPEDAPAAAPGTMYKIGQPAKAPQRGIVLQVNGVRERTESLPDYPLRADEKLVLVDVTMRVLGDAKPASAIELNVVDGNRRELPGADDGSGAVFRGEQTRPYSRRNRRGVLAYVARRAASGFSFRLTPNATDTARDTLRVTPDTIMFDLGGAPAGSVAPQPPGLAAGGRADPEGGEVTSCHVIDQLALSARPERARSSCS